MADEHIVPAQEFRDFHHPTPGGLHFKNCQGPIACGNPKIMIAGLEYGAGKG
jgi:hypothetical protein